MSNMNLVPELTMCSDNSFMRSLALCLHIETVGFPRSFDKISRKSERTNRVRLTSRERRDDLVIDRKCLVIILRLCIVFDCYSQAPVLNFRNHLLTLHRQSSFSIQRRLGTSNLPHIMQCTGKNTPLVGRVVLTSAR